MRDRVVQMATKIVIEPIFEADAKEAHRRVGIVMDRLGLELHPEKTKTVCIAPGS